MNIWMQFASQ